MLKLMELITNYREQQLPIIYSHFAKITLTGSECDNIRQTVLPELYKLFDDGLLRKDLVFLNLLANPCQMLLLQLVKYEVDQPLNLHSGLPLFAHCYYRRKHWFAELLRSGEPMSNSHTLLKHFDIGLQNEIKIFELIKLTNQNVIATETVQQLLNSVKFKYLDDVFIAFYVNEIKYILTIISYCKQKATTLDLSETQLFLAVNRNKLLELFSALLPLHDATQWHSALQKLKEEESRTECNLESDAARDVDEFRAYVVLANLIKSLQGCINVAASVNQVDEISKYINNARDALAHLNPKLNLRILEDTFSMCFLKRKHFLVQDGATAPSGESFVCADKELRLLLHFLRPCIDDLIARIPIRSTEAAQLTQLNLHVKEALWRLAMLDDLDSFNMSHMLSDSETLIQISLKEGRFDKAHQVIQIFNLEDSALAQEIIYTEKLNDLRNTLQQAFKLQHLQRQMPSMNSTSCQDNKSPHRILDDFLQNDDKCRTLHDLTDVAFIATMSNEDTTEVLDYIQFSPQFHDKVTVLLNSIHCTNLREILISPSYDFDLEAYRTKMQFHHEVKHTLDAFMNCLGHSAHTNGDRADNQTHLAYKIYSDLKLLAGKKDVNQPSYLNRLFNYLKIFLRLFNTGRNNTDLITRGNFVSYFDLLHRCRADWMAKLLFERKMDPRDFEQLFVKLKIDLLYTTALNCFPRIQLGQKGHGCTDREFQEPTRVVFSYIAKRNWLLAFIINEIFSLVQMDVNVARTKYFTLYADTYEVNQLKTLYGNNGIIAALHQDYYERCVSFINEHLLAEEIASSGPAVEPAEEISEGHLRSKWMKMLLLIDSIPESKFTHETHDLRDAILVNLVSDTYDDGSYKFVRFIKNDALRRQVVMENFMAWPGEFCISLLKMEVDPELFKWSERIQFCEDVRFRFDLDSWYTVHELCSLSAEQVYEKLLTIPKAALLLTFNKFYKTENLLKSIPTDYMVALFNCGENLNDIAELLHKLDSPVTMCLVLVETVRNLNQLEFIIEQLVQQSYDDENFLKNVRVSSKILRNFQLHERDHLWCLINSPLSLIEMLIMNTKLDKLGVVLADIQSDIENCEFSDSVISLESIDELLRKYAEKSLEFRVILEPHPSLLKSSDNKLLESLDSLYGPDRKYFEMPPNVPSKAEWTPNDHVLECMCCQNTVFSMFNRRHHCRRCGRVICFNCSTKRMQVASYGDILVRVCLDCYDQSKSDAKSDSTSNKSIVCDYWFLSDSAEHNAIVRQEFSYEHAPSVSLCLSIMKYHTNTHSYPKFLLDQCDVMLKHLQPPAQNAPQEVDYMLVIKMMKSLAIAAKMISSECQLPWGSSQADRILSQADLFALLAERGCLNLLPPSSSGAPYVDAIILRKLRDKLLMQEQWYFALDVSTKAGLENAGVFAAWGKSCLKAGCLQMAREKFQRCFDKTGHYDSLSISMDEDLVDGASFRTKYSRPMGAPDNKPLKNPPILEQIIEILESKTITFTAHSPTRKANEKESANAIWIKAKLRNLKSIANGNLESRADFNGCNVDPVYFQECLYYLKKYGSHLGLLQFYLKHDLIKESLIYMYDNKVTGDIFIEVYIICLRDGKINQLQKDMSRIDSTLEIWKEYLKGICRHLEKQGLLHSLYQLQQYMVDYVRAAMTCIRFYKDNATSYQELSSNIHFLDKAECHLLQELEQQQWVEVNAVVSRISDGSYEEKPALSNPSLVMKMDSRTIDQHIRTIKRQTQVTRFLAQHEKSDLQSLLPNIMPNIEGEAANRLAPPKQLPTLFDSNNEKVQLAVLLIICGQRVQDGYDLAHNIIQDYKLKTLKVYCHAGRQLAREDRYNEIAELVNCIRSKGSNDPAVTNVCDEMLTLAVRTLNRNDVPTSQLEALIKLITDRATKISIYIETRQLKSAYLLAAKYNRFGDIRRILREAELINKLDIKKLCQRLLQVHSHSKD